MPSPNTLNVTLTGTGTAEVLTAVGPFAYHSDPLVINLTIDALGGNDTLFGTSGPHGWHSFAIGPDSGATLTVNNALFGGFGDDVLYSAQSLGNLSVGQQANYVLSDTLTGGAGDDTYFLNTADVTVVENGGGGTDRLVLRVDSAWLLGTTSIDLNDYSNIEDVYAIGSADFDIIGDSAGNVLHGSKGANAIYGGQGDDLINGGAGADSLTGDQGSDTVLGGGGGDIIMGGAGGDNQLNGGAGNDTIFGAELNDMIRGNAGDDEMAGGDGDDTLFGVNGDDSMTGGLGDDTYLVSDSGDVVVEAFAEGVDIVQSADASLDGADYTDVEVLQLLDGGASNLNATAGNQVTLLIGNSDGNELAATTNDTQLFGGTGDDTLFGGSGDDSMWGEEGSDLYVLNIGATSVTEDVAGTGSDTIESAVANLQGSYYTNVEVLQLTGSQNLSIYGGAGAGDATQLYGNSGNNGITGYTLDETMDGGAGADSIWAGDGDDSITGGQGNDELYAEDGDDFVDGSFGDDIVWGGDGLDTLVGGTGADVFLFVAASDFAGTLGTVIEQISDFSTADGDQINLNGLGIAVFDGTTGLSGTGTASVAEDSALVVVGGVNTYRHTLLLDVDGDGASDYMIDLGTDLNQFIGLSSSDFIF